MPSTFAPTAPRRTRRASVWMAGLLASTLGLSMPSVASAAPKAQPHKAPAAPAEQGLYGPPSAPSGLPPKPKVKTMAVKAIVVHGNQRISDDRILLMVPFSVGDQISEKDLAAATKAIKTMGYFQDAQVVTEPAPGGVEVDVDVVENPVLNGVVVDGATKVPESKLEGFFQGQIGDVINSVTLKEAVEKIKKAYNDAGYPLAGVTDVALAPGGILHVHISEGTLYAIKIEGNQETKPYVIMRELTLKPGQVITTQALQGDLRRLYNLNYFEDVTPRFEPAPNGEVTLVIVVKEKQTGSINVGAGYNTQEGIVGMVTLKKDNLFGTGQQVGADISISQYLQTTGELTYANPWIDNRRTSLGANVYLRQYNNFLADFREDSKGASVNIGRAILGDPITSPFRATLGIQAEQVSTWDNVFIGGNPKPFYTAGDGPLVGQPITLDASGVDFNVAPSLSFSYDTRDIIMNPTDGNWDTVTLNPILLDWTTPLYRGTGSFAHYFQMPALPWAPTEHSTIALGLHAGLQGGQFVPAYERFFATGTYLIRGWPEYVTPGQQITSQYPVNFFQGDNAVVGSIEYRFPIFNVVSGVLFGDSGILWDNGDFNTNLLHSGYGLGLRLNTPLGLIGLDYGMSGEANVPGQFHFAIGQQF